MGAGASRWLLVAALVLGLGRAAGAEPWPTEDERQRLARGEVVYRVGAAPRDGALVPGARGAIAFVRVPAGPEPVWAILMAPRAYPEIFPGLKAVEILEENAAAWLLRTEGKVGPFEFRYHTRYRIHADTRTLVWRLDLALDNDVFHDNWGWWHLAPDGGATLVVYAIGSVPSSWQPLAGFFERRGITRALAALRDAALRRAQTPALTPTAGSTAGR